MAQVIKISERRTNVDMVYDYLYDEIVSLRLLPGTRISEADIAAEFDVSRQPVRNAFSRLENRGLLLIRPQKATEVRRFSSQNITKSRFIRAAVEAEVLRRAARLCDAAGAALLDEELNKQSAAVTDNNFDLFRGLDYDFHQALCHVAQVDYAFDVIEKEKANVDRLCVLSLSRDKRLNLLLDDHTAIAKAVKSGDEEASVAIGMEHLSRLDSTIDEIRKVNAAYFED